MHARCTTSSVATLKREAASKLLAHNETCLMSEAACLLSLDPLCCRPAHLSCTWRRVQGFLLQSPCCAEESWEAEVHAGTHIDVIKRSEDARSLAVCCVCLPRPRQVCRQRLMASKAGWCTGVLILSVLAGCSRVDALTAGAALSGDQQDRQAHPRVAHAAPGGL